MDSKIKPHIYLISGDTDLIDQFCNLKEEYRISYDEDGRLLRRLKSRAEIHNVDLVISGFEFFTQKIIKEIKPKASLHFPIFLVLSDSSNGNALFAGKYGVKYLPVYLPVDFIQLKSIVAALLKNRENVISIEEKNYYKLLYNKAPVVQFLVDPLSFIIVEANRAAAQLFGRSREHELEGQSFEVLLPENCNLIRQKLIESGRFGESNFTCTLQIRGSGSLDFAVFITKVAIRNRFLLFMSFSDITYSKNAERILTLKNIELQKTNSELDSFVYSTSHELRAPLMSVLGLINLFETEANQAERGIYTAMMKESIKKLDNIIHDIVDYARNARSGLDIIPVDFNHVLGKIINKIGFMADQNKVELRFKVNQQFPFRSDIRRIEIIINNLACNGIKFFNTNAEKPFVEVLVEVDGEFALISVEDNGRGIPDDHLPKIFDMFFR
ncbi:MAG TPA: PAS domain-containing sensor histidine kinase, partial [Bacteroidales bacterium]|nr:PAS domain-containing sensor histidine kinase [Bacteroidales bacterium]